MISLLIFLDNKRYIIYSDYQKNITKTMICDAYRKLDVGMSYGDVFNMLNVEKYRSRRIKFIHMDEKISYEGTQIFSSPLEWLGLTSSWNIFLIFKRGVLVSFSIGNFDGVTHAVWPDTNICENFI